MKKYFYYILLTFLGLHLSGCEKDLLEKHPQDQLSEDEFWQNRADFEMAMTAVYGSLQWGGIFSYDTPNWDVLTDNGYGQHNGWGSQEIVQGNISPSTGGYIYDVYNASYEGISRVNNFLDQLYDYQGDDIDKQAKLEMEAQAKFIRGYYYWMLYFSYAEVPIVTEPLSLEDQIQPKSSAAEVLNQTLSDLDFAISNLPEVLYVNSEGRVVKTSAQALKARVLLFSAYGNDGIPNHEVLAKVKNLCLEIMDSGYELDNKFENVFRDGTQEGNPEIIFSIKFLAPDNSHSMDQVYGDWLAVSPLQNFVDSFEEDDIRRDITLFEEVVNFDGNIHDPSNNDPTGYGLKKFLTPGLIPYGYSTQSQQDWVMLRYGEVLLMYAEAQNELSGPDASVYEAMNKIRFRANLEDLSPGLNKEEMTDKIRHERRIELAFEGLRYYDLKRWHIAQDVLNNITDGIIPRKFEERFYHWPLPQSEIDKSQGELKQNPDYQ